MSLLRRLEQRQAPPAPPPPEDGPVRTLWTYHTPSDLLVSAITRDSRFVIAGGTTGRLLVLDLTGRLLWSAQVTGEINRLALAEEAGLFLVGTTGQGRDATLWDYEGRLLHTFATEGNPQGVALTPDAGLIAVGSQDKHLYAYDRAGTLLFKQAVGSGIRSVALTADGAYLFAGAEDQQVHAFDRSGAPLWTFAASKRIWAELRVVDTTQRVLVGANDGFLYALDYGGAPLWRSRFDGPINAVAAAEDGQLCAVGGQRFATLLDDRGRVLWQHSTRDSVYGLALSPDGRYLLFGTHDRTAYLYDRQADQLIWQGEIAGRVYGAALSTGGQIGVLAATHHTLHAIHNHAAHDPAAPETPASQSLVRLVLERIRDGYRGDPHQAVVHWFGEFERSLRGGQFDVCDALLHDADPGGILGLSEGETVFIRSLEGTYWLVRGIAHARNGQYAEARACGERSRALQDSVHNQDGVGQALAVLSTLPALDPEADDNPAPAPLSEADAALLDAIASKPRILGTAENLLAQRLATAPPADQVAIVLLAKQAGYLLPLVQALDSGERAVRAAAAAALTLLEPGPDDEQVAALLASPQHFVRWQGLRLARYRARTQPDAFATVKARLWPAALTPHGPAAVPDPLVRREQALLIQTGGDANDLTWLLDALDDPDPDAQIAVVEALGAVADRRAIPALHQIENRRGFLGQSTRAAVEAALVAIEERHPLPAVQSIVFVQDDPRTQEAVQQHVLFLPDATTIYALVTIEHARPGLTVTARWLSGNMTLAAEARVLDGAAADPLARVQPALIADEPPARPEPPPLRRPFARPDPPPGLAALRRPTEAAASPRPPTFRGRLPAAEHTADEDEAAPGRGLPPLSPFGSRRDVASRATPFDRTATSLPYENVEPPDSAPPAPRRSPASADDNAPDIPEFLRRVPRPPFPSALRRSPAAAPVLARRLLFSRFVPPLPRPNRPRGLRDLAARSLAHEAVPDTPPRRSPLSRTERPPRFSPSEARPPAPPDPPEWLRRASEAAVRDPAQRPPGRRLFGDRAENDAARPARPRPSAPAEAPQTIVFALPRPDAGWREDQYTLAITLTETEAERAHFRVVAGVQLAGLEPGYLAPRAGFRRSYVFLTRTPSVHCRVHLRDAFTGRHLTGRLYSAATGTLLSEVSVLTNQEGAYAVPLTWEHTGWQPGTYRLTVEIEHGGTLSTEITLIERLSVRDVRLCHRVDDDQAPVGTGWPFHSDDTPHCVVELGDPPPGIELRAVWYDRAGECATTEDVPYVTSGTPDERAVFALIPPGKGRLKAGDYSVVIKSPDAAVQERSFQIAAHPRYVSAARQTRAAAQRVQTRLQRHHLDGLLAAVGGCLLLGLILVLLGWGLNAALPASARASDPILSATAPLRRVTPGGVLIGLLGALLYGGLRTRVRRGLSVRLEDQLYTGLNTLLAFSGSALIWYGVGRLGCAPGDHWPDALWGLLAALRDAVPVMAWAAPLAAWGAVAWALRGGRERPFTTVTLITGLAALGVLLLGYAAGLIGGLLLGAVGEVLVWLDAGHALRHTLLDAGAVLGFYAGPICAAIVYDRQVLLLLWDGWNERRQADESGTYSLLDHLSAGRIVPVSAAEGLRLASLALRSLTAGLLLTLAAGLTFDSVLHPALNALYGVESSSALAHALGATPVGVAAALSLFLLLPCLLIPAYRVLGAPELLPEESALVRRGAAALGLVWALIPVGIAAASRSDLAAHLSAEARLYWLNHAVLAGAVILLGLLLATLIGRAPRTVRASLNRPASLPHALLLVLAVAAGLLLPVWLWALLLAAAAGTIGFGTLALHAAR